MLHLELLDRRTLLIAPDVVPFWSTAFLDADRDAVVDPFDFRWGNTRVDFTPLDDGVASQSITTRSDGVFAIDLSPARYKVTVNRQTDDLQPFAVAGDPNYTIDLTAHGGSVVQQTLPAWDPRTSRTYAVYGMGQAEQAVWIDLDRDSVVDDDERQLGEAIPGNPDSGVPRVSYGLNLPGPGTYRIAYLNNPQTPDDRQAQWTTPYREVTVSESTPQARLDLPNFNNEVAKAGTGTIIGRGFWDWNGNGLEDEPWVYTEQVQFPIEYGGGSLVLDLDSDGIAEPGEPIATGTVGNGFNYRFTDVAPGTYQVLYPVGTKRFSEQVTVVAGATTTLSTHSGGEELMLSGKRYIEGRVFNDANLDQRYTESWTETPLSGWTVYIDSNLDGQLSPGETQTRTDPSGSFRFYGVPAGVFRVRQVARDGWSTNVPGATADVTSRLNASVDFPMYRMPEGYGSLIGPGSYSDTDGDGKCDGGFYGESGSVGRIYLDLNNNSIQDVAEPWQDTHPYSDRLYNFFGPQQAGTYWVRFARGSNPENVTPGNAFQVTVAAGQITPFPQLVEHPQAKRSNHLIQVRTYRDADGDDVMGGGENQVPVEKIFLDLNRNGLADASEPQTEFPFVEWTGIAPGSYQVGIVIPPTVVPTGPILREVAVSDSDYGDLRFGLRDNLNYIQGRVFVDLDADGVDDPNEPGVPNIFVYNDLNNDGVYQPGVENMPNEFGKRTDSLGRYSFESWELQVQEAHVRLILPPTFQQTYPFNQGGYNVGGASASQPAPLMMSLAQTLTVVPTLAATSTNRVLFNANFAVRLRSQVAASISGVAWNDTDGDGVRETDESLASGATIFIDANSNGKLDSGEASTQTDASGSYSLGNLSAGTYRVMRVLGSGFTSSKPTAGYQSVNVNGVDVRNVDFGATATTVSTVLQAEAGVMSGGTAKGSSNGGYTGTGYADFAGQGSAVAWSVTRASAGIAKLELRYANGATNNRPLQLLVNGSVVGTLNCEPTGSWTTWKTVSLSSIALPAGTVTIKAVASTTAGGANVDQLTITSAGTVVTPPVTPPATDVNFFEAENGAMSGGTAKSSGNAGFTGTGFADFAGQGSAVQFSTTRSSAGTVTLEFRYANGSTANRPLQILVNNVVVGTVACVPTGAWTTWKTVALANVALPSGAVTIKAVASTAVGGANVDSMAVKTGTVTPPPTTGDSDLTLEAESAKFVNGTGKGSSNSGFTGTGYADFGGQGSAVDFVFNRTATSTVSLLLRYANGSTANRPLQILVNGNVVGTIACTPTGSWSTWQTATLSNIALPSGTVTIRATASTSVGGGNVDWLKVQKA